MLKKEKCQWLLLKRRGWFMGWKKWEWLWVFVNGNCFSITGLASFVILGIGQIPFFICQDSFKTKWLWLAPNDDGGSRENEQKSRRSYYHS